MRLAWSVVGLLILVACRTPSTGSTPFGVNQGPADVAGFAWTTSDLPKCIAERTGKAVFVYDIQTVVQCDPLSATWVTNATAAADSWKGGRAYVAPTVWPVASTACANGGIHTDSFVDANANLRYDSPADNPHAADDTCNGADGSQAVYSLSNLPRGNVDCPLGGLHLLTWVEKDGKSGFGAGDQKVVDRNICNTATDGGGKAVSINGQGGPKVHTAYHPLKADKDKALCPQGGFLYEAWLSLDAGSTYYNSQLDTGYVSVAVCTTGRVSVGSAPILSGDHCGSTGGKQLTFLDTQSAQALDAKLSVCEFDPSQGRGELARMQVQSFTTPPSGSKCKASGERVTACVAKDSVAACDMSKAVDLCPETLAGTTAGCTIIPLFNSVFTMQCGTPGNVLIDAAHGFADNFCPIHTQDPGSVSGPPFDFVCDDASTYDYNTKTIPPILAQTHPPSPTIPPNDTTPADINAYLAGLNQDQLNALSDSSTQVVEDVPGDLSDADLKAVIDWIRIKTTAVRLPFCYRQTKTRGVGTVPGRVADCPAGYTNNGLTCGRGADTISAASKTADCPSGYTNTGVLCQQPVDTYDKQCDLIGDVHPCKPGYTDFGCTCTGGGDILDGSHMSCPDGYHLSSADLRCIYNCPAGYTNTGETCFLPASTLGLSSMTCHSDETKGSPDDGRCYPANGLCGTTQDYDTGLCYPKCDTNFHGIGPVCWQNCQASQVDCAVGCADNKDDCAYVVVNQVMSPLVVAANIATLGLGEEVNEAGIVVRDTLIVGSKTYSSATKGGAALIKVIKLLQTVKPAGLPKDTSILRRVWFAKFGSTPDPKLPLNIRGNAAGFAKFFKVVKFTGQTSVELYKSVKQYQQAYTDDFIKQTSQEINDAIDAHFGPDIATYIKAQWANVSLDEMTKATAWNISSDVLNTVSIFDISGVTGLVAAYAQPICEDNPPFPTIHGDVKGDGVLY